MANIFYQNQQILHTNITLKDERCSIHVSSNVISVGRRKIMKTYLSKERNKNSFRIFIEKILPGNEKVSLFSFERIDTYSKSVDN